MHCPKKKLSFLAGRAPTRYGIRRLVLVPATMVLEWTSSLQLALTGLIHTALQLAMAPIRTALQLCQGLMQTALQQVMKLLLAALQHQLVCTQRHSKHIRSVWTVSCSLYGTLVLHAGTYADTQPWLFACKTAVQADLTTMPTCCHQMCTQSASPGDSQAFLQTWLKMNCLEFIFSIGPHCGPSLVQCSCC